MHISILPAAQALALCLALAVGGSPASASSTPKKDSHAAASTGAKDELQPGDQGYVPPHSSNMPMLLVPAIVDGRRSHYIFASYRLVMHNELQVDKVNQKIAWLHDAFLREVFRSNPIDPKNPHTLNKALIEKRFKAIANDMLHDDIVKSVYFSEVRSERELIETDYVEPRKRLKSAPSQDKPASKGH